MNVLPPALERLIADLNGLPGIGKKTATRLALHLVRGPAEEARNLARNLAELHEAIGLCDNCFAFSEENPCSICADPERDPRSVCIVEESADLMAIEKSGAFQGEYHVLHGALSPMDGVGPEELNIGAFFSRVQRNQVEEVLIATSSTVPGEATAAYLSDELQKMPVRVTRLACGLPMGMDVKYADEVTLRRAIAGRR